MIAQTEAKDSHRPEGGGGMDVDDLEQRNRPPARRNMASMSVSDLEEYLAGLESELARAKEVIARKPAQRTAAEGLFNSVPGPGTGRRPADRQPTTRVTGRHR